MCKIRDVSELYALADKCARAEEGRRLPGETVGAEGSDSDDSAPTKKNRRRNNKKRQGKEVLAAEQSSEGGGAKAAKSGNPGKGVAACDNCKAVAAADKQDGTNRQYCKIHRTKGHDLQSCKKVEQLVQLQRAEYERRDKEKAQGDAGGSGMKRPGKEVAQDVAVADKQDGNNKQYCKIHRTKGHDLQSCKKVEQLVEQIGRAHV